jgi:hypothetical protein
MATQPQPRTAGSTRRISLGVIFLAIGLLGHLLAAMAEGGRAIHYRHHIFGFFVLSVVSGILVTALSRFFWRGRHDVTLLIVGALQTVFGLLIYAAFTDG